MTHKALIIGGPEDGKEVELRGAFYVVHHPDGTERKYEHKFFAYSDGDRFAKWYFLVEEGVTEADIMNALWTRYRKE